MGQGRCKISIFYCTFQECLFPSLMKKQTNIKITIWKTCVSLRVCLSLGSLHSSYCILCHIFITREMHWTNEQAQYFLFVIFKFNNLQVCTATETKTGFEWLMVTFVAEFVVHVQNMSVKPMCQLKIVYMHTCHLDLNTYHGFKETMILIVLNCPIMRSLQ